MPSLSPAIAGIFGTNSVPIILKNVKTGVSFSLNGPINREQAVSRALGQGPAMTVTGLEVRGGSELDIPSLGGTTGKLGYFPATVSLDVIFAGATRKILFAEIQNLLEHLLAKHGQYQATFEVVEGELINSAGIKYVTLLDYQIRQKGGKNWIKAYLLFQEYIEKKVSETGLANTTPIAKSKDGKKPGAENTTGMNSKLGDWDKFVNSSVDAYKKHRK